MFRPTPILPILVFDGDGYLYMFSSLAGLSGWMESIDEGDVIFEGAAHRVAVIIDSSGAVEAMSIGEEVHENEVRKLIIRHFAIHEKSPAPPSELAFPCYLKAVEQRLRQRRK